MFHVQRLATNRGRVLLSLDDINACVLLLAAAAAALPVLFRFVTSESCPHANSKQHYNFVGLWGGPDVFSHFCILCGKSFGWGMLYRETRFFGLVESHGFTIHSIC